MAQELNLHNRPSHLIGRTITEAFFFKGIIMNDDRYLFLALDNGEEYILEASSDGKKIYIYPNIIFINNQFDPRDLKTHE